jgi:hypothetical protein
VAGTNTATFQLPGMRLLKMLALVLGSGMFFPVSCTSIQVLGLKTPHEVRPDDRLYRLFFTVAVVPLCRISHSISSRCPNCRSSSLNTQTGHLSCVARVTVAEVAIMNAIGRLDVFE